MSWLAPLFLLGAAGIGLPILFHLIRQRPQGRVIFSSSMFLTPSPPRIRRRNRLDAWWLLLLRALALLLVAVAFARPFLRSASETTLAAPPHYIVLLLDQSASMRRADLWQQAIDRAGEEIDQLPLDSRLALVAFDNAPHVLRQFDSATSGRGREELAALEEQGPSWYGGDLASGLITASEMIDDATQDSPAAEVRRTIVIVSDMQEGGSLAALRGFAWPASTAVRIETVLPSQRSNASLALTGRGSESTAASPTSPALRVVVTNAAESTDGSFEMRWTDATGGTVGSPLAAVTVAPGARRIINIPSPPATATALEIEGDDHPFDNRHFVVVPQPVQQTILFLGPDVEDPRASLQYYLERVSLDSPVRELRVEGVTETAPGIPPWIDRLAPRQVPLVVFHHSPQSAWIEALRSYMREGGHVLVVADASLAADPSAEGAVQALSDDRGVRIAPAEISDYALLGRLEFASPLFSMFADPRYSDFSKIQFWKHQTVSVSEDAQWQTLARFDDGDPAVLRRAFGQGELVVLAAGWQPTESQLALSTKFVPLIAALAEDGTDTNFPFQATLDQPPPLEPSPTAVLLTPAGDEIPFRSLADAAVMDSPGRYMWRDADRSRTFALNVSPAESQTTPMDRTALEQLGIPLAGDENTVLAADTERRLRDAELERDQQWWRVLLVGALAMIGLETWFSARSRAARIVPGPTAA